MTINVIKSVDTLNPGDHYMTTTHGMSGFFAVEMWLNDEDGDGHIFPEPWNTGMGRYATREEAEEEARMMADCEDIPYLEAT